jgi:hypothetical protein
MDIYIYIYIRERNLHGKNEGYNSLTLLSFCALYRLSHLPLPGVHSTIFDVSYNLQISLNF